MFEQIVLLVVLAALSYLLAPKPESPDPSNLKDFDVPVADPEKEIIVFFGTGWLKDPNVVWYGDLGYSDIKSDSSKK